MTEQVSTPVNQRTFFDYMLLAAGIIALSMVALALVWAFISHYYGDSGVQWVGRFLAFAAVVGFILLCFAVVSSFYRGARSSQSDMMREVANLVREAASVHADIVGTYTDVVNNDDKRDIEFLKVAKDLVGSGARLQLEQARTETVEGRAELERIKTDERLRLAEERAAMTDRRRRQQAAEAEQRQIAVREKEAGFYDLPVFESTYEIPEVE